LTKEKRIKPGEINRYAFNTFQFFSRRTAKGSRLRLVLSYPHTIEFENIYNDDRVKGGRILKGCSPRSHFGFSLRVAPEFLGDIGRIGRTR